MLVWPRPLAPPCVLPATAPSIVVTIDIIVIMKVRHKRHKSCFAARQRGAWPVYSDATQLNSTSSCVAISGPGLADRTLLTGARFLCDSTFPLQFPARYRQLHTMFRTSENHAFQSEQVAHAAIRIFL